MNSKLLIPLLFIVASCHNTSAPDTQPKLPLIGAIRWDGWTGGNERVNQILHRTLAPKEFHDRIPFFGKVISEDSVQIADSSQLVMDQEIAFAKESGLDYWAFVLYNQYGSGLYTSLSNYLQSKNRNDIHFCAITEEGRLSSTDTAYLSNLVRLINEPGYMTVLDGRPLWYIGFIDSANVIKNRGSFHSFRNLVDSIRTSVQQAGMKNPYVVIMDFNAELGNRWRDSLGADAISSYVAQKQTPKGSYQQLNKEVEQFWNECKNTGAQVVPICVAGWSPKPRIDYPNEWSKFYPKDVYYGKATPEELAKHIETGMQWLRQNKEAAPAQCALVYAWNEFDEGGWLAPTLYDSTARIKAISEAIRVAKEKY